jgi:hypothetical protein
MLISPHYHDRDWKRLNLSNSNANDADWQTAADIVEDRVRGRLINWIDKLAAERFAGFAVLALDCILIESLFGLETGKPSPGNAATYHKVLTRPRFLNGGFDTVAATCFCECIRNGISHDNETRKGWLIERNVPNRKILVRKSSGYQLNRTEFHKAVVAEFSECMKKIREGNNDARQKMRKRMEDILKISAPPPT